MTTYHYLKFLNLQYWYCIIYSLFGGKCTIVDSDLNTGIGTATITATPPPAPPSNFWAWLFGGGGNGAEYSGPFAGFINALAALFGFIGGILALLWAIYSALAFFVSGILFLIVLGSLIGLMYIRYEEMALYGTLAPKARVATESRKRWQAVLDRAMSVEPRDWRECILEADSMLGELLGKLGYAGLQTAERLRAVPEGAFATLPNAWEAHRIRNFVSARSSNFILTQRETLRVLKLYEQVFEEFEFI